MNRRGFLSTILAASVAPAIVRADSLMRIIPRDALLFVDADVTYTRDLTISYWITEFNLDDYVDHIPRFEFQIKPTRGRR